MVSLKNTSDLEDISCSASTGPPNPEEGDRNHDPRGADKCLERRQQSDPDNTGNDAEKACQADVFVRKAKMLKKPELESGKLFTVRITVQEKPLGMRQVIKLNELMDMSP